MMKSNSPSRLTPQLILEADASGMFPMGMERGRISWFSPDPRGIMPLDRFHTPHGLSRALKRSDWEIRIDTDFTAVINACAARSQTWITEEISHSYQELFKSGHAHSVEVWLGGRIAGGLYGISIGGAFFGESMFHYVADASKVALWHLIRILKKGGFSLLDTQWITPHLEQFGAIAIPRNSYLNILGKSIGRIAALPPPGLLE